MHEELRESGTGRRIDFQALRNRRRMIAHTALLTLFIGAGVLVILVLLSLLNR